MPKRLESLRLGANMLLVSISDIYFQELRIFGLILRQIESLSDDIGRDGRDDRVLSNNLGA